VITAPAAGAVALHPAPAPTYVTPQPQPQPQQPAKPVAGERPTAADPVWPCQCGTLVPMAESSCPSCGRAFLGDLSSTATPRHRTGGGRWPTSRAASLLLAGVIALVLAVGLPLLLALLG
jgi:hypothetical protein